MKSFSSPKSSPSNASEKEFAEERIRKELQMSSKDPITNCSHGGVGNGDDIFHLQGAIMGPSDTLFKGGVFFLSLELPYDYPFKPPKIILQTKVLHPNIDAYGTIHIYILGKNWSPSCTRKYCYHYAHSLTTQMQKALLAQPANCTPMIGNLTSRKQERGP